MIFRCKCGAQKRGAQQPFRSTSFGKFVCADCRRQLSVLRETIPVITPPTPRKGIHFVQRAVVGSR